MQCNVSVIQVRDCERPLSTRVFIKVFLCSFFVGGFFAVCFFAKSAHALSIPIPSPTISPPVPTISGPLCGPAPAYIPLAGVNDCGFLLSKKWVEGGSSGAWTLTFHKNIPGLIKQDGKITQTWKCDTIKSIRAWRTTTEHSSCVEHKESTAPSGIETMEEIRTEFSRHLSTYAEETVLTMITDRSSYEKNGDLTNIDHEFEGSLTQKNHTTGQTVEQLWRETDWDGYYPSGDLRSREKIRNRKVRDLVLGIDTFNWGTQQSIRLNTEGSLDTSSGVHHLYDPGNAPGAQQLYWNATYTDGLLRTFNATMLPTVLAFTFDNMSELTDAKVNTTSSALPLSEAAIAQFENALSRMRAFEMNYPMLLSRMPPVPLR